MITGLNPALKLLPLSKQDDDSEWGAANFRNFPPIVQALLTRWIVLFARSHYTTETTY